MHRPSFSFAPLLFSVLAVITFGCGSSETPPATADAGAQCLPTAAACDEARPCCDGLACRDGACAAADPCAGVACTPSDQCHVATCDPLSGACVDAAKADGVACDDDDACTTRDACESGACVGAAPVVCATPDQCHDAGTCDPATGVCSNPAKEEGFVCDDADACTQLDFCREGACLGVNPVVCAAGDACHVAGACAPATGVCSAVIALEDGAACDDGLACNAGDQCLAGVCRGAPCAAPVPAEGGAIALADGSVALEFAAGTLPDGQGLTITATPVTEYPDPLGNVIPGSVYDFGPDGTLFEMTDTDLDGNPAPSVRLTIGFDPAVVEEHVWPALLVSKLVDGAWVPQRGSVVDPVNHTVTALVTSFSEYALTFLPKGPVALTTTRLSFDALGDAGSATLVDPTTGAPLPDSGTALLWSTNGTSVTLETSASNADGNQGGNRATFRAHENGTTTLQAAAYMCETVIRERMVQNCSYEFCLSRLVCERCRYESESYPSTECAWVEAAGSNGTIEVAQQPARMFADDGTLGARIPDVTPVPVIELSDMGHRAWPRFDVADRNGYRLTNTPPAVTCSVDRAWLTAEPSGPRECELTGAAAGLATLEARIGPLALTLPIVSTVTADVRNQAGRTSVSSHLVHEVVRAVDTLGQALPGVVTPSQAHWVAAHPSWSTLPYLDGSATPWLSPTADGATTGLPGGTVTLRHALRIPSGPLRFSADVRAFADAEARFRLNGRPVGTTAGFAPPAARATLSNELIDVPGRSTVELDLVNDAGDPNPLGVAYSMDLSWACEAGHLFLPAPASDPEISGRCVPCDGCARPVAVLFPTHGPAAVDVDSTSAVIHFGARDPQGAEIPSYGVPDVTCSVNEPWVHVRAVPGEHACEVRAYAPGVATGTVRVGAVSLDFTIQSSAPARTSGSSSLSTSSVYRVTRHVDASGTSLAPSPVPYDAHVVAPATSPSWAEVGANWISPLEDGATASLPASATTFATAFDLPFGALHHVALSGGAYADDEATVRLNGQPIARVTGWAPDATQGERPIAYAATNELGVFLRGANLLQIELANTSGAVGVAARLALQYECTPGYVLVPGELDAGGLFELAPTGLHASCVRHDRSCSEDACGSTCFGERPRPAQVVLAADARGPATNSDVSVGAGQLMVARATGTWRLGAGVVFGPDGEEGRYDGCALAPTVPRGALVGSLDGGTSWFLVGSGPTAIHGGGTLLLAANGCASTRGENDGALTVTVQRACVDPCAGVTCTSSGTCTVARCDSLVGECVETARPDETACDDGSLCTVADVCRAGSCVSGTPVTCAASSQCHLVGACNPSTGICTNPLKGDGATCDDGNACTRTDTCRTGACEGANPVVCAADACAGTCSPSTGLCTIAVATNGTPCSDGNACTNADRCQSGACTGTALANDTPCNDGSLCTQRDFCSSGICVGGAPVLCSPATLGGACSVATTVTDDGSGNQSLCNPRSGLCEGDARPDDSACDVVHACVGGSCRDGACGDRGIAFACDCPAVLGSWRLDGNLLDAAGSNHGQMAFQPDGVTYVTGRHAQAASFGDAATTDRSFRFGKTAGNFGTSDFSVEWWMKTAPTTSTQSLFGKGCLDGFTGWYVWVDRDGTIHPQLTDARYGTVYAGLASTVSVADGGWHHVVLVRAGTSFRVYVDGALASTDSSEQLFDFTNGMDLEVGGASCGNGATPAAYSGEFDQLTLHGRALSVADIQQLRTSGTCTPLVATCGATELAVTTGDGVPGCMPKRLLSSGPHWKQSRPLLSGWHLVDGLDDTAWERAYDRGIASAPPWNLALGTDYSAHWIWPYETLTLPAFSGTYFRRRFTLAQAAQIQVGITAAQSYQLWIDGQLAYAGNASEGFVWTAVQNLAAGEHLLAVEVVVNRGSPGGLLVEVR